MPSLGADMQAGTLSRWLVKPGDVVKRGQIVAVVETDKSEIEAECFESGVVEELLVEEGVKVAVGTPLARLSAPAPVGATAQAAPVPAQRERLPQVASVTAAPSGISEPTVSVSQPQMPVAVTPPAPASVTARTAAPVQASPLARRLASMSGVDLAALQGTGPGGVVVRRDVLAAAAQQHEARRADEPPPESPTVEVTGVEHRLRSMRDITGALMARSKREIPHYYLTATVDMRRATEWLLDANQDRPVAARILPAALLLKAVALACREVPDMNGHYIEGAFQPAEQVNVGVAVSLRQGGLMAPAILDADTLALDDLMAALLGVVKRARVGSLRSSEASAGTITVTNLGDQGAEAVYGVIYAPQVALVGFGRIEERVVADHGMLGVRPVVTATLAADHRVSDGHRGSLFLAAVARLLQEPEKL